MGPAGGGARRHAHMPNSATAAQPSISTQKTRTAYLEDERGMGGCVCVGSEGWGGGGRGGRGGGRGMPDGARKGRGLPLRALPLLSPPSYHVYCPKSRLVVARTQA